MLKKRTLKEKMLVRINKSKQDIFLPNDFFDLSDRDQVGRALRELVQEKRLIKLGQGVFAKAIPSPLTGKPILTKNFIDIAKEALQKLGVQILSTRAEEAYNSGSSTQVPTGLMIAVKSRISRILSYNGRSIKYERVTG